MELQCKHISQCWQPNTATNQRNGITTTTNYYYY